MPGNVSAHGADVDGWTCRGIGEAIAIYYAEEGASLYLCARSESNLAEVAEQCKTHGATNVQTFAVDMMDPKALKDLVENVGSKIDVLVNNAGVPQGPAAWACTVLGLQQRVQANRSSFASPGVVDMDPVLEGDPEKWESMVALNLLTPMRLTRELGPYLAEKKEKGGVIINISSVAGRDPVAAQAAYAASKWGLTGWSLSTFEVTAACTSLRSILHCLHAH
jgi:3-oxoacyl-[acyl-carrier protein] reductase